MNLKSKIFPVISALLFLSVLSYAQPEYYSAFVSDTIPVNLENHYTISGVMIIPFTETILLGDSLLKRGDYEFLYSEGSFTLSPSLPYSIFDTLVVTYRAVNLGLRKEYKRRSLVYKYDEKGDTLQIAREEEGGFTPESIFGSGIEKSGTLVRGFTVGTTKDFSLSSGLRLQLSGKLSEEIEVVAALTDENTPIQPEGNTERLEELDKVFIQVKHPNATGTFGDYQVQRRTGEFGFIDRKLQGLMGEVNYQQNNGFISVAGSRGKFNTNNIPGSDGVQGPYRLSGINNERDIIVIAGTEKVFIDGIPMRRGEGNDYTIEYANAEITFTPQRLITSSSRITVDFEYTDRRYSRNFFGGGIESGFFDKKLQVKIQYIREGDDRDSPIDLLLSDQDKAALFAAGDDRNKAVKSGVSPAQPDSLGIIRGTYIRRDTVYNNQSFAYYLYNPGDSAALYNVSFSFTGEKTGDYVRESLGNFRFVGVGQGNYLPVIFIPLPELRQIGNIVIDINPLEDIYLSLEYAGSLTDRNLFSDLDDKNNYGYARNIFLKVDPKKINLGDIDLGRIGLSYKDRFIQDRFTPADRLNEIEFNRHYNISSVSEPEDEELREIGLTLLPVEELRINSTLGLLRRGGNFKSDRYNNILSFSDKKHLNIDYNLDYVESENLSMNTRWLRQHGTASYQFWILKPGLQFLSEDKKDKRKGVDSLITGSLRYYETIPFIELADLEGISAAARFSIRDEYLPLNGRMIAESRALTHSYEVNYSGIKEVNSTLNFTYRMKKFKEEFRRSGSLDNETILVRTQTRLKPWDFINGDIFYEVSTQRAARLERVFIRVEQGTGNFRYIGDSNNNGIADENEFEPVIYDGDFIQITIPTDQLYPVIDLKASTRWKIRYADLFDKNSLAGTILSPFSTETMLRVEENSTEEDYARIYLLKFSWFQNEKTIRGFDLIQQDFFLFENNQEFSLRFRFQQRNSLNQFSGGTERAYNRERSLRIRFKMVEEVSNQTDLVNITDNVDAPVNSNRRRLISGNRITSDFSYRPERNIEVGFIIEAGRSEDVLPLNPTIIDLNSQGIRFNLSFLGTGRLRIDLERTELLVNTSENFLPFELTEGNFPGKNYFWRLNFDYRLTTNLQSTVSYDGRSQEGGRVVHTARAEVRAYF